MSALGQQRTLFTTSLYVRFIRESGHSGYRDIVSAKCHKQTSPASAHFH
jgi:hypothetical protein